MKVKTIITVAITIEHEDDARELPTIAFDAVQAARELIDNTPGFTATDVRVLATRTETV